MSGILKQQIRALGIDDGTFKRGDREACLVGAMLMGNSSLEGVLFTKVAVDGEEATGTISKMVKKSRFYKTLRCIFLDGIAVAGFNVVDIGRLSKSLRMPVIAVTRKKPSVAKVVRALEKLKGGARKIMAVKGAGPVHKIGKVYFQFKGTGLKEARQLIRQSARKTELPECIRVAHIMATGIARGESIGRA